LISVVFFLIVSSSFAVRIPFSRPDSFRFSRVGMTPMATIRSDALTMVTRGVMKGSTIQQHITTEVIETFLAWFDYTLTQNLAQVAIINGAHSWSMAMCGSGGRKEMSPYSDIDIFVVLEEGLDAGDITAIQDAFKVIARAMLTYNTGGDFVNMMYCPVVNFLRLVDTAANMKTTVEDFAVAEITNCLPEATSIRVHGAPDPLPDLAPLIRISKATALNNLKTYPVTILSTKTAPWDIKTDFYRPLQMIADMFVIYKEQFTILNTIERVQWLETNNHLHADVAGLWEAAYNAVASIRIRAELNTAGDGGEHHSLYFPATAVPGGHMGTVLTTAEKALLDTAVTTLACLRKKAVAFGTKPTGTHAFLTVC